jgi:hypothetical protein
MRWTYNSEVVEQNYKSDRERRAKANEKGEIWTCGDGWAMVVKL